MAETNILGDLLVKLRGDLSDLEKALDKAQTNSETTSKNIEKDFKSSFDKISKDAKKIGDALSKYVTLPMLASGAAAIKFASDVTESTNAVNVVFKESAKVITDWGKNSAKQAGLFSADFNQAAATVGAQLINTGSATKEAADQTILLTQRAADMASIFNTDVNTALQAIQSQLRGESEPIRKFAVSIDEAAVNAKALSLGLVDSKGEVTTYGKAQARVALILEQTAKFQGDFVNTSKELANGLRVTTALAKDQAAEFGKQLIPTINDIVQSSGKLLEKLSGLSDTQRKNIITIAGFSAALGPAILAVNGISKAIVAMNAALLANPIVLATTALVALGATAIVVNNNIKDMQEQKRILDNVMSGGTTGDLRKDLELVSKEYENINRELILSRDIYEGGNPALIEELELVKKIKTEIEMKAQGQRAVNTGKIEEAQATKEISKEELKQIADRKTADKEYNTQIKAAIEQKKAGLITSTDLINKELELNKKYIEDLIKIGYTGANNNTIGDRTLKSLLERNKAIEQAVSVSDYYKNKEITRIDQIEQAESDAYKSKIQNDTTLRKQFIDDNTGMTESVLQNIEKQRKAFINAGVDEVEANRSAQSQILQTYLSTGQTILSTMQGLFSQIQSLYNQDAQNRIDAINYSLNSDLQAIDARMQAELEAAGLSEATTVEGLKKKLDAALAQGELVTAEELRQEIAKAEIKEKYEREKEAREKKAALATYKVQLEQFKVNQKLSRAQAVIDTASAALKTATSVPWPWNLPLIAAMVALGAKQIDIINDQVPPSPPALARGGEIGANNPTLAVIGDNTRYNEVVAPLSPDTFAKIANGILVALSSRARPSGVTENTAGASTMYGSGSNSGSSMTVNAGIIVANDAGLRAFARVITPYLHEESVRIG